MLGILLLCSLIWSLLQIDPKDGFLRGDGLSALVDIAAGLTRPDLSADTLTRAVRGAGITIAYAVAGLSVAIVAGLAIGVFASGTLAATPTVRGFSIASGRGLLAAMRAVHELVWAWMLVVAIGLSPYAAVFAIAIPYAGILGRIYADLLVDVPHSPLRALRAVGASEFNVLVYGRMPLALPDMAAYSYYRFECGLRASAIMGFVGLGGLGYEIQIALNDLAYRNVGTYLIALVALIAVVELWSSTLRRALTR